jgi:hypothetical protein
MAAAWLCVAIFTGMLAFGLLWLPSEELARVGRGGLAAFGALTLLSWYYAWKSHHRVRVVIDPARQQLETVLLRWPLPPGRARCPLDGLRSVDVTLSGYLSEQVITLGYESGETIGAAPLRFFHHRNAQAVQQQLLRAIGR